MDQKLNNLQSLEQLESQDEDDLESSTSQSVLQLQQQKQFKPRTSQLESPQLTQNQQLLTSDKKPVNNQQQINIVDSKKEPNPKQEEDLSQIKDDDQDNDEQDEEEDIYDQSNFMSGKKQNKQLSREEQIYNFYVQPTREEIAIINSITQEIEEKIHQLENYLKDQNEEQIVNIRRQQLACVQTLVLTYGKSPIKLIHAYIQLSEAYINYECYLQAIEHLTIALYKNKKMINDQKVNQIFWDNVLILQMLGQCYLEMSNIEVAIDYLDQALKKIMDNKLVNDGRTVPVLSYLVKCYIRKENYFQALEYVDKEGRVIENVYGAKSVQSALALIEAGKIQGKLNNMDLGIELYSKGIEMLIELNYDFPESVATLYQELGEFHKNKKNYEGLISCLHNAKQIYMQIFGQLDKRVIKIQKQISVTLLKNDQLDPALQYLQEGKQIESQVYGESSVQVAKTKKMIATIYVLKKQYGEAEQYLQEALKIFESYGLKKEYESAINQLKLLASQMKKEVDEDKLTYLKEL